MLLVAWTFASTARAKDAITGSKQADAHAIGAAFFADGRTFTRIRAAESPHALEGHVLTSGDAFSGSNGVVADPEVVFVAGTYHRGSRASRAPNCGTTTAYGVSHATSTDGIHWTVLDAQPGFGPGVVTLNVAARDAL